MDRLADESSGGAPDRIMTAHEMKQRAPQTRRFHNYAFAEGWALRLDHGRYCDELDGIIETYLRQCSPLERIEVRGIHTAESLRFRT